MSMFLEVCLVAHRISLASLEIFLARNRHGYLDTIP